MPTSKTRVCRYARMPVELVLNAMGHTLHGGFHEALGCPARRSWRWENPLRRMEAFCYRDVPRKPDTSIYMSWA